MAVFHHRLERIFEWCQKRCRLEESRLSVLIELTSRAEAAIEEHRKAVLGHRLELVQSASIHAFELAALGQFCHGAKARERELWQKRGICSANADKQCVVVQAARQRLRLIEKLRERRLDEYRREEDRKREELAAESHLAGFVRALNLTNEGAANPRIC